jgi:hypothetical protein
MNEQIQKIDQLLGEARYLLHSLGPTKGVLGIHLQKAAQGVNHASREIFQASQEV